MVHSNEVMTIKELSSYLGCRTEFHKKDDKGKYSRVL